MADRIITPQRFAQGMTFDEYVTFTGSPVNLAREGFDVRRFSHVNPRLDWSGYLRDRYAKATLTEDQTERDWLARYTRPLVGLEGAERAEREESFAAWRRLLEAAAEQRPLVLVFEDLHWADDGLLDFVDHLADWATTVPLLIVGTARPELLDRRPGWGGGLGKAV